jgi:hypothetical protein
MGVSFARHRALDKVGGGWRRRRKRGREGTEGMQSSLGAATKEGEGHTMHRKQCSYNYGAISS